MPRKKVPCPKCGRMKSAEAKVCRRCTVPYLRTQEHRQKMSDTLAGRPKPWLRGKTMPGQSERLRKWWTPERREAKRQEMLARNPLARYHGLSSKGARRLRTALGRCEACGHDGSESRLDVHHRNGNKQDQNLQNLAVLCRRCHMQLHSKQGDLRRKTNQD